jgi:hypothetical protein
MDVAWLLGPNGPDDFWELRMSMRSFWQHYAQLHTPLIIGCAPEWIDQTKVRCIPWPDPYRKLKDANLLHKALRLAVDPLLSDPFILCSDDHLLLKDSLDGDFRSWHSGEIATEITEEMTSWQKRLVNTGTRLRAAGYSAYNFDTHVPQLLKKAWIYEVLRFDFAAKPGMCLFSAVMNSNGIVGELLSGAPVRGWLGGADVTPRTVKKRTRHNRFTCLTNASVSNLFLKQYIEALFPNPAPWELSAPASAVTMPAAADVPAL